MPACTNVELDTRDITMIPFMEVMTASAISLRFPAKELHDAIRQLAARESRSVNYVIIRACEESLKLRNVSPVEEELTTPSSAAKLTQEERTASARKAARARWKKRGGRKVKAGDRR